MSESRLAAIRERLAAATSPPWNESWIYYALRHAEKHADQVMPDNVWDGYGDDEHFGPASERDATFIAHAREDVEALLRVAEELEKVAAIPCYFSHGTGAPCPKRRENPDNWCRPCWARSLLATALGFSPAPPERNR